MLWQQNLAKGSQRLLIQLGDLDWSPHGKNIVFGISNGEVQIFGNTGIFCVSFVFGVTYVVTGINSSLAAQV